MSNPTKLNQPQIVPPTIRDQYGNYYKSPNPHDRVRSSGPSKISPELLAIFDETVKAHEATVKAQIDKGELDSKGNPPGTKYRDDGTAISKRRAEPVGSDGRRRRKQKIHIGQLFGDLKVLKKGPRVRAARPNLSERWRCRCSCGTEIIVPKYYLVRKPNPKTHCGCKVKTLKSVNRREYRIWMMINARINNPKHTSYKHYQERGITLFPEWCKDQPNAFKKFFEHVGKSPSNAHSLDRVHNNRGYVPGNLRWATAEEQRANQGDSIGGYSIEDITNAGYTEDEFLDMIMSGKEVDLTPRDTDSDE